MAKDWREETVRIVDADALLSAIDRDTMISAVLEELMDEQAIDVDLIRCRDCAMSRKTVNKSVVVCIRHGFGTHEDPDGYCYKAKRKGGNDE